MPVGVRNGAKVVLTAAAGGGAAYAVTQADKKRYTAAPKTLWNALRGRDPMSVTPEEVAAVGAQFGIANLGQACSTQMTGLYDVYLMSLVRGLDPVQGWEAAALAQFRQTLGIDEPPGAGALGGWPSIVQAHRARIDGQGHRLGPRKEFQSSSSSPRKPLARSRRAAPAEARQRLGCQVDLANRAASQLLHDHDGIQRCQRRRRGHRGLRWATST